MSDISRQKHIEELNEILESRESEMLKIYPRIRKALQTHYDWPEIDTLRHEACLCLVFGLHQAAITFINHMLESFLKYGLSYKDAFDKYKSEPNQESGGIEDIIKALKPYMEKYDDKDLSQTINQACSKGIITKPQKKQLHIYRKTLRNPYSHATKKGIYGETEIPVQGVHMNEKYEFVVEPEAERKIFDLPFLHGPSQYYHAKANATPYFLYVDKLVRESYKIIFPNS